MKIALIILISILIILLISVFVLVILDTLKIDYLYYYLEDGKLTKTTKQDKKPDVVYFSDIHIGAYLKKEEASKAFLYFLILAIVILASISPLYVDAIDV